MRVRGSRSLALLAAGLAASYACVCTGRSEPTFGPAKRPPRGNVFVYGAGAEPESVDPGIAFDSPGITISRNLFEGLMRQDPRTLKPLPGMAERFELSEDRRRYVFHLRDARWSSGRPVTAGDFVWSWLRVLEPATAAQYSTLMWDLEGAKAFADGTGPREAVGVRALDDRTLEVRLEKPVPWFLDLLAFCPFMPVPREAVETHGILWTRPEHVITNGAWLLQSWQINYEIRLAKSPTYWDRDQVRLDRIVAIVSDDNHAMVRLFRAGELDWLGSDVTIPQEYLAHLQDKRDYHQARELTTYFYFINLRKETPSQRASPLHDVRVRRALNMAIDKQAIVDFVTRGGQRPARNVVPDIFTDLGYDPPLGDPYDPEGARRLLAQAGFGPGGRPFPTLQLIYNTHDAHKQVAEAIQEMWKKHLGVGVEIANQEWKVFMSNRTDGFFEIARAGWTGDFQEPYSFLSLFLSGADLNEARWESPEFDALLDAATRIAGEQERFAAYRKAEAIVNAELPVIPVYFYSKNTLYGDWVKGLWPNSMDTHPFRDVWIEGG